MGKVVRKRPLTNPFVNTGQNFARNYAQRLRDTFDTVSHRNRGYIHGPFSNRIYLRTPSAATVAKVRARQAARKLQARMARKANLTKGGAPTSKSRGFLKVNSNITKYGIQSKIAKKGVLYRLEAGNTITPKLCGYVGHCTMPYSVVMKHVWRAIVKAIVAKCGVAIQDFADVFTQDFVVATSVTIRFRFNYDPNNQSSYTYTTAGGETYEDVAIYFSDYMASKGPDFQLISIELLVPGDRKVEIILTDATVMFDVKSTLKIQNRSKNAIENNEADDVDNVPLYGKSYEAWTSGLRYFHEPTGTYKRFVANNDNGIMDLSVNANGVGDGIFAEPPPPTLFVGVKKYGKVHLDPGEIKTSVLTERFSISLDRYFGKTLGVDPSAVLKIRRDIGKCRLFALEKMLEVNTGPEQTITEMNIAYEHDYKLGVMITYKNPVRTTTVIQDVLGST